MQTAGPPAGWNREQVSHLAHAAREARMSEVEYKPLINWSAIKDWLISNQLSIAVLTINLVLGYYFVKLFCPKAEEELEVSDDDIYL